MKNNRKSVILALFAIMLWSTVGSAFKLTLDYLNYTQIVLFSSLISLIFLAILIVATGKIKLVLSTPLKLIGKSAIMGFLNPFAYYLILLKAYSLLQAQEAVSLNYTWPIVLVILSAVFLKQKMTWLNIFSLLISFAGMLVIATRGNFQSFEFSNPLGIGLALLSAFFWAGYWLLNMKDVRNSEEKLFMNFLFGFIYTLIYSILTNNIHMPESEAIVGVVYIGLFEMGITFVIWLNALKYAENTSKVSNLVYLSPFLSMIFISISVGEKIMISTLIGLTLIIGGILVQHLIPAKK